MMGKTVPTTTEPKDARPRRAPSAAPRPDAAALLQGLERLRDGLLHRLVQIETLALEQAQLLEQDASEREQTLQERVAVLEAAQSRLQAEAKRREQEWEGTLQQLESDRRLLTEAWDRLERQQIEAVPGVAPSAPAPPAVERPAAYRPPADDPSDDAVTRAILRQFQALKTDVRRNAKGRNGR